MSPRTAAQSLALSLFLTLTIHPAHAQTPEEQSDLAYAAATAALSQQNWAEAELHFERVLMFNPLHAEARVQLALLFAQQGKTAAAAGFLQSLVDDPRTPPAHSARLQTLLSQLTQLSAPQPAPIEAATAPDQALQAPPAAARVEAKLSLGYTTNPYARADIDTLTLTLPEGRAEFPIDQSLSPAPFTTVSLGYLAPNQCGADLHHQSWGGIEPQNANRLLLFCYTQVQGEQLQLFATTQQSSDGTERHTAGLSWPTPTWRLTAQRFHEPNQNRQGYALRLDRLLTQSGGANTLLFAEAENATLGQTGYAKVGLQQTYPLTPALDLWGHLSYQRDQGAYSPLLEDGVPRRLLVTQASLEHTLGTFAGWQLASALQLTHRTSNLKLFEFNDLTVKISFKQIF